MMNNLFKPLLLLITVLFSAQCITAQETVKQNKILDELLQTDSKDRLIFEIGHANWTNSPEDAKLKWNSRAINIYLMYDISLQKKSNVSFAPGIGIGTNIYSHNQEFGINDDGNTTFSTLGDAVNYDRNILSTNFVDFLLELRFRTNPDKLGKRFKVAAGFKGGYLINGHSKWVGDSQFNDNVTTEKFKNFTIPNLNSLRYGYTLRIGYSNFNIVGFYSAAPLFEIGKSTVNGGVKPFYIGFSFNSL